MKDDPHPAFTGALLSAAIEAKKTVNYNASYYIAMLNEQGGVATAEQLIHKPAASEGFAHLYEKRRLDLTAEAFVLLPRWSPLFQNETLAAAHKRLASYKYSFSANSWQPGDEAEPLATPIAKDADEPPSRMQVTVYRILRDTAIARQVKRQHEWKCQICGNTILLPNGKRYAEAHHIRPLGGEHQGPDSAGNVLCLCPNHHAECDLGVRPLALRALRMVAGHEVDPKHIEYHNGKILTR